MRFLRGATAAALAVLLLAVTPAATAHRDRDGDRPSSDPTVISEWNSIALTALAADAATTPPRKTAIEAYLYFAFMHGAMYNAVVGIEGGYEPYRFHESAPRGASSQAAAVAAAHRILVTYCPEQKATLDAAYAASLAKIPDGRAEDRGVAYGVLAADTMIAQRVGDGRNAPILFTKTPAPGVWRPTPPALAPFSAPWLGYVKPLLVPGDGHFADPGPAPALTSKRYTRDFEEVKALGSASSTQRTAAQTETATFFSGNPAVQFTTALRDQATTRHLDIVDSARLFAAVHMSLADQAISVWYTKHHYGVWRPITAIQQAGQDGNPATTADPTWTSLIPSPPYPDYVSGYNGAMGAFSQALEDALGTRHLRLTLITTAFPVGDPRATRHYDTGDEVRQEVIDARVWLGIHFRFADTSGARMGQQVGDYALEHYFGPVRHHHDDDD